MGYYLQSPADQHFGKADFLCREYNGQIISRDEARSLMSDPEKVAIACVVNNGNFEAAAYCFSVEEFKAFSRPDDHRPKEWIRFDNVSAIRQAAGYSPT